MTRDQAIQQLMASAAKLTTLEIMIEAFADAIHILPHGTLQAMVQASNEEAGRAEEAAQFLRRPV